MRSDNQEKFSFRLFWNASTLQLLGVIILPLALLVLIFAFGSTFLHQRAMRELVGERDEIAVRVVTGALDEAIAHRLTMLRDWVALAEESFPEKITISESDPFLSSFDGGFVILTSAGERLTPAHNTDFLPTLAERLSFIDQISSSGVMLATELDSKPVLLFGAASRGKDILGIGAVSVNELADEIINLPLRQDREMKISIIDAEHRILFQTDTSLEGEEPVEGSILEYEFSDESGVFFERRKNFEYIISYSHVSSLDWVVVMEEPWEAVISPILETTRIAPLALVPLLLITLAGLWFANRQIVQPLKALETRSESLAEGDFSDIDDPVGGIMEIRSLQRKLRIMAQKVQSTQQGMKDYIGAITNAQEEERRRLARELHDDTLQSIIALKQRVQLAQESAVDDSTRRTLAELHSIAEQTIEDLRRTTRALRPIFLEDLGLVTVLDMLARETEEISDINVQVKQSGLARRLKPSVELALYRMAQEALNNVARHAGASRGVMNIHFAEQQVTLEITDNGVGFSMPPSPAEFAHLGHFGLLGMHERADLIGAKLDITSQPGNGTKIKISLKLNDR